VYEQMDVSPRLVNGIARRKRIVYEIEQAVTSSPFPMSSITWVQLRDPRY